MWKYSGTTQRFHPLLMRDFISPFCCFTSLLSPSAVSCRPWGHRPHCNFCKSPLYYIPSSNWPLTVPVAVIQGCSPRTIQSSCWWGAFISTVPQTWRINVKEHWICSGGSWLNKIWLESFDSKDLRLYFGLMCHTSAPEYLDFCKIKAVAVLRG